jgi:hypothetical protein
MRCSSRADSTRSTLRVMGAGEFFIGVARKGNADLDKQLGERKNSWCALTWPS